MLNCVPQKGEETGTECRTLTRKMSARSKEASQAFCHLVESHLQNSLPSSSRSVLARES